MKRIRYNDKIMIKTVIIYLLIGICTVGVMGVWMFVNYKNTNIDYCERELIEQQTNMYLVDSNLDIVYKNLCKIAESEELRSLMSSSDTNRVYEASKFMKRISSWTYPLTPLYDVFIYVRDDNYVYTSQGRYTSESFFDSYFSSDTTTQNELMNLMLENQFYSWIPAQNVKIMNTELEAITFMYSYPEFSKHPEVVVAGIMETSLLKVGQKVENVYSGIISGNGELISGNINPEDISKIMHIKKNAFEDIRIGSSKYVAFVTVSSYNNWKYVELVPRSVIYKKLFGYRMATIIIFICFLMFVLALSLILFKTYIKPFFKMISHLQKLETDRNIEAVNYDYVEYVVGQMVENTKHMVKEIDKYRGYMRRVFLKELLDGKVVVESTIERKAEELGVVFDGNEFLVVLIWVNGIKTSEKHAYIVESVYLMEILEKEVLEENAWLEIVEYDRNTVAVIMKAQKPESISYIGFTELLDRLLPKFYDNWKIAVGRSCSTAGGIFYSFVDAKTTLKYMNIADNSTVMIYNNDIEQKNSFYYPPEIEQRLILLITSGDKEDIELIFEHLYNENRKRKLGVLSFKHFKQAFCSTVIRIINEASNSGNSVCENFLRVLDDIDNNENLYAFCDTAKELMLNLCEVFEMSKIQKEDKFKKVLEDYIDQHYFDYGLTRKTIAEHFKLSESYFSRRFSELFGKTFSQFLEEKRLNEAIKLIKETQLTMNEIAERLGYSNVQVMRRAFVRQFGEPPSKYRDK